MSELVMAVREVVDAAAGARSSIDPAELLR